MPEGIQVVLAERGLTRQRNAALAAAKGGDVVFFDDDALPREDYLAGVAEVFHSYPDVVGMTGKVAIDGVPLLRALTLAEMRAALASAGDDKTVTTTDRLYGCNMAFRRDALDGISFDERLPLYGWLEDLDFARRVQRRGRLVVAAGCVAAHQGNEIGGRGKHARFGYSVIANALYLQRKGSVRTRELPFLILRPALANLRGALAGSDRSWRRERLAGMAIALSDIARGRLCPERATEL